MNNRNTPIYRQIKQAMAYGIATASQLAAHVRLQKAMRRIAKEHHRLAGGMR